MESKELKSEIERIERMQRISVLNLQIADHEARALGGIRLELSLLEGVMGAWAQGTDAYKEDCLRLSLGGRVSAFRSRDPRLDPEAKAAFSPLDRVLKDHPEALGQARRAIHAKLKNLMSESPDYAQKRIPELLEAIHGPKDATVEIVTAVVYQQVWSALGLPLRRSRERFHAGDERSLIGDEIHLHIAEARNVVIQAIVGTPIEVREKFLERQAAEDFKRVNIQM